MTATTSIGVNSKSIGSGRAVADKHQHRRHEQGDLQGRPQRDADRQVHLVLQGHQDRRRVLGRVADDRHHDHADEDLGQPQRRLVVLDGADQHLAHQGHERRSRRAGSPSIAARPSSGRAELRPRVFVLGVVEVLVRHEAEDQVQAVGEDQDRRRPRGSGCARPTMRRRVRPAGGRSPG